MIKIKKYYCYYNKKDGKYYVDKSYPQKDKKKDNCHKKGQNYKEVNIGNPIINVNVNCGCGHKKHDRDQHHDKDWYGNEDQYYDEDQDCGCHHKKYNED